MNMCPSVEILRNLLQGNLPPASADRVRYHLSLCEVCVDMLDRLSDDPGLESWLAEGGCLPTRRARRDLLETIKVAEDWSMGQSSPGPAFESLGPYQIEAEVGRGGMGVVYRARDRTMNRVVALKVLRPERTDEEARARFLREARAAGRVEHDHLVRVYATSEPAESVFYLAMEYLGGPSLAGLLRLRGRLDPRDAARLVAEAAEGLAAAHAAGLVHRDVKPDNILIDPANGRAKVGDFGLARLTDLDSDSTSEGVVAGTPAYLSPEQARGERNVGPLTDVYSLGLTLYECLAGEPPFRGTPHRVVRQILEDDPRPPRAINERVPRDLETICLKAISKEPSGRYESAAGLSADLRRWLAGEPIHARRIGLARKGAKLIRRYPRVAGLLLALVLSVSGGMFGIFWQWRRAELNAVRSREAGLKAERDYREARDAVDRFYTRVLTGKILDQPGLEKTRADVVRSMLDYYRGFLERHGDDRSLLDDAAEASYRVGVLTSDKGDKRESIAALEEATKHLTNLARTRPKDVAVRRKIAHCVDSAGVLLSELGRSEEAFEAHRKGCEIYREILAIEPANRENRQRLGISLGNLAASYHRSGKILLALETYRLALEQFEALVRLYPGEARELTYLAMTFHNMALVIDNRDEKLEWLRKALGLRRRLVEMMPGNNYFLRNLGTTLVAVALEENYRGKYSEALALFDEAATKLRVAVSNETVNQTFRRDLAEAIQGRVGLLATLGRSIEAIEAAREGEKLLDDLAKIDPKDAVARVIRCDLNDSVARAEEMQSHLDIALQLRRKRLAVLEDLVQELPDREDLAMSLSVEREVIDRLMSRQNADRDAAIGAP